MQVGFKILRKFSLASVLLAAAGLGCVALLDNANGIDPMIALRIAIFAVIPICVILASVFAVSFLDPIVTTLVLLFIPYVCYFMPNSHKFGIIKALVVAMIFFIPLSAVGCFVHYLARRIRAGHLSWSFSRGIAWGMSCGLGAAFALKSKLSHDIAFYGDYSVIWIIVGIVVAISAIAGIKKNTKSEGLSSLQDGPADGKPST
jgi:hypothetical protein